MREIRSLQEERHVSAFLLMPIIDFFIRHITFTFIDKYYLQTNGTALGTKMATAFANIFMDSVEKSFLSSFPLMPTVYYRYMDDIIWSHGIDKFKNKFAMPTALTLMLLSHMKHLLHCLFGRKLPAPFTLPYTVRLQTEKLTAL